MLPSHQCRLGCGRIESMRHTVNCPRMKPFWDAIFGFMRAVMHARAPPIREKAIIFNEWKSGEIGPPDACALIRHAYGQMYRDFTLVDTLGRPFNWKVTFARTLRRFRSAVHRYAVSIRHFRAHRRFTSQPQHVSEETLKKFETLVTFDTPAYTFRLTQAFVSAIDAAEVDAGNQQQPAPQHGPRHFARANVAPAPRAGAGQPGPP